MEVTLHRFVLAEFNTHRAFSRNSASSRAIPVEKQLAKVKDYPAWPLEWPAEQPGMQGGAHLLDFDLELAQMLFEATHDATVDIIDAYFNALKKMYPDASKDELKGHTLHKSLINRLLEPFMWHTIIVTSDEWENFFSQRCSPLAQPEIRAAAELMRDALEASTPQLVRAGGYHLPFISNDDQAWAYNKYGANSFTQVLIAMSVARCARVSYLTQDGIRDPEKDLELYDRLITAEPPHWSPLEHVATPGESEYGNFNGWVQIRHIISGEHTNTN